MMLSSLSNTACAVVVVPEGVHKCYDVLAASPNLVNHTPCPLGLSIYAFEDDKLFQMSPQPLIYVSEQVARDRAPEKHVMNGMGVRPGWYVIARPGRFKVHAAWVNQDQYGLPWEDALRVALEVDGQGTNQSFLFDQNEKSFNPFASDAVFEGYVDQIIPSSLTAHGDFIIRPFAFESTSNGLETKTVGPSDVGTITLKVDAGILRPSKPVSAKSFNYSRKQVSAKAIAREGRTMKVSDNQSTELRPVRYSRSVVTDRRNLPEAEITIYVRERSWLLSRRLIDDNDQPVTYDVFRKLLKENVSPFSPNHVPKEEVVNVDEEPPKKRPKIKEQMILYDEVDPIQPREVIDLT